VTLKSLTPNIMAIHLNRTVEFYRDVLGFTLTASVPQEGRYEWAAMRRDDVEIMFQARRSLASEIPSLESVPIGGSLTFYIRVNDVRDLYAAIRDRVTIVQDLHETFYHSHEFAIRDCNGYILVFAQYDQAAVAV